MQRRPFVVMAAAAFGLLGVETGEEAQGQVTQLWNPGDRFPASGPAGQFDAPVGVGANLDHIYVVGTQTLTTDTSVFTIIKRDFAAAHPPVVEQWPVTANRAIRTAKASALYFSPTNNYTVVALTGEVVNSNGFIDCVTLAYQDNGSGFKLLGTATLSLPIDALFDAHPVSIAISPNGTLISVATDVQLTSGSALWATLSTPRAICSSPLTSRRSTRRPKTTTLQTW